jgi:crotonobetainyl-CoA:carnitine CoA-transferase CaiB-like acyl-CoA transferase
MYEICVQQMAKAIHQAQTGSAPQRSGNADPTALLQDVYPARGDDRWIAISAFNQADVARLQNLAGNRPIAEWTGEQDAFELAALLQRKGLAAGVVQDIEDLLDGDPSLRARGALIDLPHPKLGRFGHVRTPITFSRDRVAPFRAPSIGEHSRDVALTLAGIDAVRFAKLTDEGLFK